jgi:fluoride exporter
MVVAGGIVGTIGRALVGGSDHGSFPWGTLLVNLVGTALLGYLIGRVQATPTTARWIPFIGVGVMGSLTTFGTMMVELVDLADGGAIALAVVYTIVSLTTGLGLGLLGLRLGEARG